jgi:DNA repair protein RadC
MKQKSDAERFGRYQTVIDALLARHSFHKNDLYADLDGIKKAFIGRVVKELTREGYLSVDGGRSKPLYFWTEKRHDFDVGHWIDKQVFTAAVMRSPSADRPRERLLRLGVSQLKTSELLAILIRSGLQGESATQAAEKLSARFGNNLQALSLKARGELKQITNAVGETAYCQIMAALELGKRLARQEGAADERDKKITNTADALAFCKNHFARLAYEGAQEEFHVVLLDQKHHLMRTVQITVGLSNQSLVHPREIFRPAIQESASAIILVHNHPSGDPTPSQEDKTITRELKGAAEVLKVRLLDHIILGKGKAFGNSVNTIFRF